MGVKNKQNIEIIYGKNACFGCIEGFKNSFSNRQIFNIFILNSKFDEYFKKIPKELRDLVKSVNNHDLFVLTHEQDKHQGIAMKVSCFRYSNIEDIMDITSKNDSVSLFLLDCVQDPHNVGNIIRSAFCLNVDGIILSERNSCDITSAVVRTSSGYSEQSLICKVNNVANAIDKLKNNDFCIIGFDVNTNFIGGIDSIINKNNKCVFVFGSEGSGMKELTKKKCDFLLKLPMRNGAESLNVANTATIVAWEINKKKCLK